MDIVDTHAHIYHGDETRYPMRAEPHRPAPATGTLEHLRHEMEANGVGRVALVQTGSAYHWDNRLLADTAAACQGWAVGVCTLDPDDPASVDELARLAAGAVRGLRLEAGREGYCHAGSQSLFAACRRLGVVVCAHLRATYLDELAALLESYPDVRVVLDHCAYPSVEDGADNATVVRVCELARYGQLHVKLTFGVTSSMQEYPFTDTHPLLRRIIDAYGPERCMWGSDFPCEHWLKKATYAQHLAVFTTELGLDQGTQEAILGGTAAGLWFGE